MFVLKVASMSWWLVEDGASHYVRYMRIFASFGVIINIVVPCLGSVTFLFELA